MAELYNSPRIYNSEGLTYNGTILPIHRTATGSGTRTETSTGVRICQRSATEPGTSTQAADWNINPARTGTGTGIVTQTADWNINPVRQATGSGNGTGIASGFTIRFRIATGTGIGTETANGIRVTFRNGTGNGTGTSTPTNWTKSLIFRTPIDNEVALNGFDVDTPWTEEVRVAHDLFKFFRNSPRGRNVYKTKAGIYTEREPQPEDIDIIYFGGHNNFVTPEEKANLVAAGYTVS